ncbi:MAG: SIS domain-containing protein [Clostridia bacterium]|nr:SIS domain-containing protein [Clostridia bacterium]
MDLRTELFERYPCLCACEKDIDAARELICETYKRGGTVYVCGNGGSCSDSDHIVGELMKGFLLRRELSAADTAKFAEMFEDGAEFAANLQGALPAVSLTAQTAILSAFANDVEPDMVYAQLVYGYARENDLVIGLSTSGNSKNVVNAIKAAKFRGAKTLSMTGMKESKLSAMSDATIRVPETETFKIQELHLPIYHYLCAAVEEEFFAK